MSIILSDNMLCKICNVDFINIQKHIMDEHKFIVLKAMSKL